MDEELAAFAHAEFHRRDPTARTASPSITLTTARSTAGLWRPPRPPRPPAPALAAPTHAVNVVTVPNPAPISPVLHPPQSEPTPEPQATSAYEAAVARVLATSATSTSDQVDHDTLAEAISSRPQPAHEPIDDDALAKALAHHRVPDQPPPRVEDIVLGEAFAIQRAATAAPNAVDDRALAQALARVQRPAPRTQPVADAVLAEALSHHHPRVIAAAVEDRALAAAMAGRLDLSHRGLIGASIPRASVEPGRARIARHTLRFCATCGARVPFDLLSCPICAEADAAPDDEAEEAVSGSGSYAVAVVLALVFSVLMLMLTLQREGTRAEDPSRTVCIQLEERNLTERFVEGC